MFIVQNKQFNLAQIATVEWVEGTVQATDPRDGKTRDWHSFKIYMSYGHIEHMLHETAEECKRKWEELIDSMEAAGH
ncbi:hypothetical protein GCM10027431_13690 [Lysobacter rhizosphaerae]